MLGKFGSRVHEVIARDFRVQKRESLSLAIVVQVDYPGTLANFQLSEPQLLVEVER